MTRPVPLDELILAQAPPAALEEAGDLVQRRAVRFVTQTAHGLTGVVEDQRSTLVTVEIEDFSPKRATGSAFAVRCPCGADGVCVHAASTVLHWLARAGDGRSVFTAKPGEEPKTTRVVAAPKPQAAPPAKSPPPDPHPGLPALADQRVLLRTEPRGWQRNEDRFDDSYDDEDEQDPVDAWLAAQTAETAVAASPPARTGEALHYVLDRDHAGLPHIRLVAVRPLLDGRDGVLKRIDRPDWVVRHRPEWATAEDLAICAALDEQTFRDEWTEDDDDESSLLDRALIERMAATGRLRWQEHGGIPVRWGEAVPVRLHVDADGRMYRCRLHPADPAVAATATLLPARPPLFAIGATLHPLTPAGDALTEAVVGLPPQLSPGDLRRVAPVLRRLDPEAVLPELPPPQAPQPVLRLIRFRSRCTPISGSAREQSVIVARVGMRYGAAEFTPGQGQAEQGAVLRDLAAERARVGELAAHRLAPWPPAIGPGSRDQWRLTGLPTGLVVGDAVAIRDGGEGAPSPSALALLRASGWEIAGHGVEAVVAELAPLAELTATVGDPAAEGWFEIGLGMPLADGRRIDLVPALLPVLREGPEAWARLPCVGAGESAEILIAVDERTAVRVPQTVLRSLHDQLIELLDRLPAGAKTLRLDPHQAGLVDAFDQLSQRWLGAERLRALAERWLSCLAPPAVEPPAGLRAELRPYQRDGLAWLQHLRELGVGGVLADDMGLGKTVQAIAHLLAEHAAGRADRPSLVVAPASMLGTWLQSLARFAPELSAGLWHGVARQALRAADRLPAVVITSYATLVSDIDELADHAWHVAIADEAQAFKNHATKSAQAMRRLDARQRLALSGTPVENRLAELHAILGWAVPGVLGPLDAFERIYAKPIEAGDRARRELLRRRVAPFLLRRTKQAVASDLPARTETDVPVELSAAERVAYEAVRAAMDARVREAVASRGLARSGIEIIEALLRLRQVACHRRLLPGNEAERRGRPLASAKLEMLGELLATLREEQRQVLVFSQFTGLLDLVEREVLTPMGLAHLRIDGSVPAGARQALVDRFQAGEAPVFLLSLKAGGSGLTLTAADTVILLDPWWNPAVERQAADRAHRIGQTRPVQIFRLIATGTVEERIRALQEAKADLAGAITGDDDQALGRLTAEDLAALLAP